MTILNTPNEIRRELAARLKLRHLPDPLWTLLNRRGGPGDLLSGAATIERLEEDAKEYMRFLREMQAIGKSRIRLIDARPTRRDLARAEAFSTFLAVQATQSSYFEVIPPDPETGLNEGESLSLTSEFRRAEFDGRVLASDAALGLATSRIAELWSYRTFMDRGVPLESHRSKLVYSFTKAPNQCGQPFRTVAIKVDWADGHIEESLDRSFSFGDKTEGFINVQVETRDGLSLKRKVDRTSTLGKAGLAARELSQSFPWREGQAVWYLLTDEPPLVAPLRSWASVIDGLQYNHARVVIEIEPWVGVRSLVRTYLMAKKNTLVGINRAPSERRSKLLAFVSRLDEPRGQPINWEARKHAWNKANPNSMYTSCRSFRLAFVAAESSVIWPRLRSLAAPSRKSRIKNSK